MHDEREDDDPLAGFGAWSDTTIDESVREVNTALDDGFDAASTILAGVFEGIDDSGDGRTPAGVDPDDTPDR
ncbi:MAG: hypothetical protein ACOCYZ_03340 [Halococcoides sp.]